MLPRTENGSVLAVNFLTFDILITLLMVGPNIMAHLPGILYRPLSLCRLAFRDHHSSSERNSIATHHEEKGPGKYLGILCVCETKVSRHIIEYKIWWEMVRDFSLDFQAWHQYNVPGQRVGTISVCYWLPAPAGLISFGRMQSTNIWLVASQQHKKILERTIPDVLKLSIARKIENNLFSKVFEYFDAKCSFAEPNIKLWW